VKDSEIAEKLYNWLCSVIIPKPNRTREDEIAELEDIIREIRQAK
jgi:hypothetical protein